MADEFVKWLTGTGTAGKADYAVAPGIVTNNVDLIAEGRIEVRIPSRPGFSPMARIVGLGGSAGNGFFWVPQINDEVLVAFHQNDPTDAYIVGGLWSTLKRPPEMVPVMQTWKRVIKTGFIPGLNHQIEFDDLLQTITIKSSTEDKIVLGLGKVEIGAFAGLLQIKMNMQDSPPKISILSTLGNIELKAPLGNVSVESLTGNIELKAPLGKISLDAMNVEINGTASTDVKATGPCSINGTPVKIN